MIRSGTLAALLFAWVMAASGRTHSVVISEILYHPPGGSEFAEAEFVELWNPGSSQVALGGASFTAGITYAFPAGTVLSPGARIVVGRNPALLRSRYGTIPGLATTAFSGALNNSGENLTLSSATGAVLATVRFAVGGDWPERPAGNGGSIELVNPSGSQSSASNWRASSEYLGSPGIAGAGPMDRVVVNELLAHTDPPLEDAVELFNRTGSPIDVGGWYLSNSVEDLLRYRIPAGTVIPPGGFRVIYEHQFNPANAPTGRTAFTFGAARGDDVVLLSADSLGNPLRWEDHQSFPASPNGVGFGRYPDGEGPFLLMSRSSLGTAISNTDPEFWIEFFRQGAGAPNSPHALGPVVFERIRYSAAADGIEFVELKNVGEIEMPLFDPAYPTNTWGLEGGVTYRFPEGLILAPGGRVVVANTTDFAAARTLLSLPDSVPVVGPYSGQLSSAGERIQLVRPDTPQLPPREDAGFVPYYVVEQIDYSASSPWPVLGSPGSQLIRRRSGNQPGYSAANWEAAAVETVPPRVDLSVVGWSAGVLRVHVSGPAGSAFRIQSVAIAASGSVTVLADLATGTFSAATGSILPDGRFRVEVEVPAGSAGALFRALIP